MERNLYLKNTTVDEGREMYLAAVGRSGVAPTSECVAAEQSLHRITWQAVYAKYSSPLFNAAAMDGIAVRAAMTKGASETQPLILRPGQDYCIVDTGDPVRPPFDAVIMAEDLIQQDDGTLAITAAAAPWQHMRPIGEDIVAGEMLLPSCHAIRPIDIGVLLSGGILQLEVYRRPRVAIFPTGNEIIEPTETPHEGDIIESNSRMFEAMVCECGGEPTRFAPLPDDFQLLKQKVSEAVAQFDCVIVNAGSSAGTEDYTVHVLRELGEVVVHGVAIKPGKPVILAVVQGKPVIGLPGYPVSAYIGFENFVAPVLSLFTGEPPRQNRMVEAVLSKRLVSSLKHREYVRVKVGRVNDRIVAAPLARGAGAAMSLVRADGFCVIPQHSEGIEAGETVDVELYRNLDEIDRTVVAIGSHDLILDLIADLMPNRYPGEHLSSTHVGSMAGLMALQRGEAHIAPTHLLDEETGEYNLSYLRRLFQEPMALIKGVGRIQGLMVKKGNPLQICRIEDLVRCRYVNRQRGAGTRVLFDHLLKQKGIAPEQIDGYEREATTHMAVAAAVQSDSADAGMGVLSAARAMGLDFIAIGPEEYDFAIPGAFLDLPHIQHFIAVLRSEEFHRRLDELGGYSYTRSGEVIPISRE